MLNNPLDEVFNDQHVTTDDRGTQRIIKHYSLVMTFDAIYILFFILSCPTAAYSLSVLYSMHVYTVLYRYIYRSTRHYIQYPSNLILIAINI